MLTAILRSQLGTQTGSTTGADASFSFILSTGQRSSLQALKEALQQKERDQDQETQCCQDFLWMLILAKDRGGWTDVIQQWIWLKVLHPDGNFYPVTSLTPDLAKLKYLMCQTVLIQAFTEPLWDDEELIQ
ncbi:hypothetical protein JVT61DRAFT_10386 [Boletus reticuloceps]|uniref:Uncharacterized protein n=1 Tax=Boletus reticuloceps TaxID=495285 RepID=A0A8I2Z066_9AGAM|nr:hypothetical protein JVT61DRAFT_10386 [Boletus reticuloceps]